MKSVRTDSEIIKGLTGRDLSVYRELFDLYFEKMTHFARYFLLDIEEAEDVVQDVFLTLWSRMEVIPIETNVRSYLFTTVKNRCINRIKQLNIEDKHSEWLLEAQRYASIPDVQIDDQLLARVNRAIDELPTQAGIIFRKCVVEGKKYHEVAAELGITINTVNTQMKRSYKFLRDRLGVLLLLFLASL